MCAAATERGDERRFVNERARPLGRTTEPILTDRIAPTDYAVVRRLSGEVLRERKAGDFNTEY